jgi:hypothetical protein
MAKQETLTLFPELEQSTTRLTNEQFGVLMRAIFAYRFRGEVYGGDDMAVDIAFQFIASQVDRSEETKVNRSKAVSSRWEKDKDTNTYTDIQSDTNAYTDIQSDTPIQSIPIHSNPILSSNNEREADEPPAPPPEPPRPKPVKKTFGKFGWVKLTDEEYHRLLNDLGEAEVKRCIAYVDESAQATGNKNKWRDWNLVIRKCHRDGWGRKQGYQPAQKTGGWNPFLDALGGGDG